MIHEVRMRIAHILVQAVKKIRQALLSTDDGGFYRPERVVEVKADEFNRQWDGLS